MNGGRASKLPSVTEAIVTGGRLILKIAPGTTSRLRAKRSAARLTFTFFVVLTLTLIDQATENRQTEDHLPLEQGFKFLYNLDFDHAHSVFLSQEKDHPEDPVAPACDAAGLLFSEFHRLGILESQFFADDHSFLNRRKLEPDPAVRDGFNQAVGRAESKARSRLAKNPKDKDALFAMTLSSGLQGDYAALIDNRNLQSLHFAKQATGWAEQLLAVDPTCSDAHVATGFSKYIIGSMSAPVRWLVRMGGISGDKQVGISELKITAANGHYLAPFARILLAIAYVREKDNPHARQLLADLRDQFPANPLFAYEIAHLDSLH